MWQPQLGCFTSHLHLGDGHMWPFIAIMITCKCKSRSHREGERGGRAHSGLHLAKPLAACPTLDAAAAATCIRSALVAQLIMLIIFISGQPKKRQQQQQQQQCETIAALTICHADGLRDGRAYRCRRSLRSKNQTKSRKGPQKMKATKAIWMSSPRTEYQMVQKPIGSSGTIATITARLMMRAASDWRLKKLSLKCDKKGWSEQKQDCYIYVIACNIWRINTRYIYAISRPVSERQTCK